jgi:hypothetical protein
MTHGKVGAVTSKRPAEALDQTTDATLKGLRVLCETATARDSDHCSVKQAQQHQIKPAGALNKAEAVVNSLPGAIEKYNRHNG